MSENMKPSGTDYLSEIPNTWDAKRIKFCAEICNGSEYADIVVDEGGFPVMGSGGEFARASKYCYTEKSVLLGRKGTIDKPLFIEEPFWCVDTMFYTKMKKGINAKYLYYCSLNIRFDFYVTSTALPSMTQRDLGSEKIAIPPLREQVVIADFLDEQCKKIDSIVTDIENQIEILQKYKKSLITETVTKGLDKSVPMKDSGIEWIGDVPDHWEVKRLKFVSLKIGSGKTPKGGAEIYEDEGITFIRSQNVYDDGLHLDDVKFISDDINNEMSSTQLQIGDILFNITGASIGRCCIYSLKAVGNVNQHVCIIRANNSCFNAYLRYVMVSEIGKIQTAINQMGGNRDSLTFEQIGNFVIPVAQSIEQIKIANYLEQQCSKIDSIIESKKEQLTKITQHKKSLIYEYVTGKKRVKGVNNNGN